MGGFCMKEQARVDRPKSSKHFWQGVHQKHPPKHPKRQTGHHNAHTVNALSPFLFHILKKLEKTL